MLTRPPECTGCPLHDQNIAIGFMRPEGSGASGVYVCAEALGEHEAKDGLPLRPNAPAGSVFDRTLRRASISRESLAISNTIHCRPGPKNFLEHAPYEFEAINHCRQHMDREIQQFRPKVIVALGGIPLRTLTGYCGPKQSITNVRGFYLDGLRYPGIPVLGTYHPAHIARDKPNLLGVFRMDLLRAVVLAKAGGQFTRPVKRYVKFPNISEAETWERWLMGHPELAINFDIETSDSITGEDESALRVNADGAVEFTPLKPEFADAPEEEKEKEEAIASEYKFINSNSRITQVQFSVLGDGDAIVLPWDGGLFSQLIARVLRLPNVKFGHNAWSFDLPILAQHGAPVGGVCHDTMWLWHHLQPDLPRGLQYVTSMFLPECLSANSQVCLTDGSTRRIKEIVDNRAPIEVWGMAEDGTRIPVTVNGWHKTKRDAQRWVRINTSLLREAIYCTPDHNIWTNTGWREAQDVEPGDLIRSSLLGSVDLIHGTVLGDGSVNMKGQLRVTHGGKQIEYAKLKARHLGVAIKSSMRPPRRLGGPEGSIHNLFTPIGRDWRERFYSGKLRIFIPPPSYAALAIWYCDDGHWKKFVNRRNGDGTATFAVDRYKSQVHDMYTYFMTNFGDDLTFPTGTHLQLYLKKKTRDRFYEAIAPYVPSCMEYKLPPRWRGRYNGWLDKQESRWLRVSLVDRDYRRYATLGSVKDRYCVTVDHPTHRFFVAGGLVSNCLPWKHRAADDPGDYGGNDVALPRRFCLKLIEDLKSRGIWAGYERHVLGLHPILVGATKRGIPVDDARRVELGERVDRLKVGVDAELQGMFPDELRGCEPKQGYVNPKIAAKRKEGLDGGLEEGERWAEREFVGRSSQRKVAAIAGEDGFGAIGGGLVGMLSNDERSQQPDAQSVSGVYGGKVLEQESGEKGGSDGGGGWGENAMGGVADNKVTRWCRIQPFLPNSSQQILKYIRWRREEEVEAKIATYRGNSRWAGWPERALREMAERNAVYKVPKKWKEDKDTTEKKELERLGAKTGDRFFSLVVEHREYGKVKSTYVDGWRGADDGRTHPTFGFAPATGQLSSVRPASMTMFKPGGQETLAEARKTQLAHWCRSMVVAPPGHRLVFVDKKSYHAKMLGRESRDALYLRITQKDIHSFITANFMWANERSAFLNAGLPSNPESWVQRSDQELGELLGIVKKNWRAIRDKKAKPCIAEGELVLTDKGLVPIQNITLDHKLWDGIEWISHSGVICKGEQMIITYDGLTATYDHEVVTDQGRSLPLWVAAHKLARLECTGDGGLPVRTCHRDFLEDSARRRWQAAQDQTPLPMSRMRSQEVDIKGIIEGGGHDRLPVLCSNEISASRSAWPSVRFDYRKVLQSKKSSLSALRWSRDYVQIREPERIRTVGCKESSSRELSRDRNRPYEQQWTLRARESTVGDSARTNTEQTAQCFSDVSRRENSATPVREPLHSQLDAQINHGGEDDWGTDHSSCYSDFDTEQASHQNLATSSAMVGTARVYDIVNAGPRFCYTVSGRLVFNCILGIGLGLGDAKCFELNKRDEINPMGFASKAEVTKFKNVLKGLFPSIFRFHENTKQLAHRQGYLITLYGYMRWFFDVFHNSYKGGQWIQEAGRDAEAAIALPVQNHSHGMLKDEVLILDGMGALEKFGFMNIVHDELQFCCPNKLVEECLHVVPAVMNRPAVILADPVVAPDGLVCDVEASVGQDWDSMQEVKVGKLEEIHV